MSEPLKTAFPYFGNKALVAPKIWQAFGDVTSYLEPFFGSGAVLFARPKPSRDEIVNDSNGFICNFWRAVKQAPLTVAEYANQPFVENDLHARHAAIWSQRKELVERLEGDTEYCDPKIAGWWVWGQCVSIMGGWCLKGGPWRVVDGKLLKQEEKSGVNKSTMHFLTDPGIRRNMFDIAKKPNEDIYDFMNLLAKRLEHVKVLCGDWTRCVSDGTINYLSHVGTTGVFLDPPYDLEVVNSPKTKVYSEYRDVSTQVATWAITMGSNPRIRVALCGYSGEHDLEKYGWKRLNWRQYRKKNSPKGDKEVVWLSPHCNNLLQEELFQ